MLSEKSGLLWVITLSLASLLLFFTVPNHQLSFDRTLIAQGEGWRIITGNLAHTNLWHLLLNLSGLCVLYSLFREYLTGCRLPLLPLLLLLLGSAVGLGIWWWCPQTQWYMGLSGALHGLFVWGALQDIRYRRHSGWLMLAGVAIKLGVDFYSAGESPVSALIGARVHIESHLIGSGAGLLLGLLPVTLRPHAVKE
ncbi:MULTISPECIES: rhombosortase [unclassified Aeromonas]|uniref:rhombosortase n=1 Tax=unclassified Aeromonas TaxID=257493 RepID=UPI003526E72C